MGQLLDDCVLSQTAASSDPLPGLGFPADIVLETVFSVEWTWYAHGGVCPDTMSPGLCMRIEEKCWEGDGRGEVVVVRICMVTQMLSEMVMPTQGPAWQGLHS